MSKLKNIYRQTNVAKEGFTLVELLVSLAITSIIMLGLSIFFTSTFRQIFQIQGQSSGDLSHFATMNILHSKMANVNRLIDEDGSSLLIQNNLESDELPFSYISLADNYLTFKDFFIFNGLINDISTHQASEPNAAGITYLGSDYYMAVPLENQIYRCITINKCDPLSIEDLNHPTDIATNGSDRLFVSDSANHRIIQITDLGSENVVDVLIETNLSFPTGLVYYQDSLGGEYLFFADTYNHQVKRLDLVSQEVKVVVGDGSNFECDNSAVYCKLNFPTGLYLDTDTSTLYIADTGNNRVLRMRDPQLKVDEENDLEFNLTLEENYALDRIEFRGNFEDELYDAAESSFIANQDDYNNENKTLTSGTQVPLLLSGFGNCTHNSGNVYLQDFPDAYDLQSGDVLLIDGQVSFVGILTENIVCTQGEGDEAVNEFRDHIQLQDEGAFFSDNDQLYFSHPLETTFSMNDLNFNEVGFQEIIVELFDLENDSEPRFSDSFFFRVGDGVLGTAEDEIEIFVSELDYPTGLTIDSGELIVADSLAEQLLSFDLDDPEAGSSSDVLIPFSVEDFTPDYKSDFTFSNLTFQQFNEGALLQMDAEIDLPDGQMETYKFTTHLP